MRPLFANTSRFLFFFKIVIVFHTVICYCIIVQYTLKEENMNSQFKKGIIEMCVIHLVREKDMYGFEIIESLSKTIDVNENTIYPILRRLTNQDYFTTYQRDDLKQGVGAPRKYYKITDLGKTKYQEYEAEWTKFLKGVLEILGGKQNEKELFS